MLDSTGEPVKIRGKKNLKPYFKEHLDVWRNLYAQVYSMISKKDDPNIIAFERMLKQENFNKFVDLDLNNEKIEEL